MSDRILFVDDEPKVLAGLQRQISDEFDIETAIGGAAGLESLAAKGPFAVVVSDMRMPGMDGVQFLSAVKVRSPESVRMMLTGCADQDTAIQAVNEGNIFRFLTKPCQPDALGKALTACIAQYHLIRVEKDLLENTLRGAIKVLAEVLALANPAAFGHASRVQRLVHRLCRQLAVDKPWQIEIAAMLSQIGCVTVPPDTLDRAYQGQPLRARETQMLEAHPGIGCDLVRHIPRLEEVARIIAYQQKNFDGSGSPRDDVRGADIPLGARILKVALDYETFKWSRPAVRCPVAALYARSALYDPDVLGAIERVVQAEGVLEVAEVAPKDLPLRAVIAEDVTTPEGMLIVGKGQEVTPSLHHRLLNFTRKRDLDHEIRVRYFVRRAAEDAAAAEAERR